jgi:hypothetical protein
MRRVRLVCLAALAAGLAVVPASALGAHPAAARSHVVRAGDARFEVLTPTLIRLEYSPGGRFEDRPTVVAQDRTPIAAYTSTRAGGVLTLRTSALVVRYRIAGGRFTAKDLSVTPRNGRWSARPTWSGGTAPRSSAPGNLGGWLRALDNKAGPVALHQGLLTRAGWYLLDDSTDALLISHAPGFAVRPSRASYQDGYFFGYGRDFKRALSDLRTLSGPTPLLPRSAFGVWFSRYWPYAASEYPALLRQFRRHHVPLDTLSVDTDWKRQASPLSNTLASAVIGKTKAYSWNGWEWNNTLFPHPKKFIAWAHRHGIDVALNIHPSIDSTDPKYPATVARSGPLPLDATCTLEQIDPLGQCHVFDLTQQKQIAAYFALEKSIAAAGVDEWWLDWCCDASSAIATGLTPDTWFNLLYDAHLDHRGDRWLVLSRVGGSHQGDDPVAGPGPGIFAEHRYAIHFTGDTCATWAMLAFEAKLTAEEGNVGLAYVSHDIGSFNGAPIHGMCSGTSASGAVVNPAMYARWVQFGAFQPILRLHSNHGARLPWEYPAAANRAAAKALRLREALGPYLYSVAREAYDTGLPIDRALYLQWPHQKAAYHHDSEFTVGSDILVRPVTAKGNPAPAKVWFPPGQWIDYFTGRTYSGPSTRTLHVPLDRIPVFVRSGGVIPTQPAVTHTADAPRDNVVLTAYGPLDGSTRVYDDAGTGFGYQSGAFTWTTVSHSAGEAGERLTIEPARGHFAGELTRRSWTVRFTDVARPWSVTVDGQRVDWRYDPAARTVSLRTPERSTSHPVRVVVTNYQPVTSA